MLCKECEEKMDKSEGSIVNKGFADEKEICYICFAFDIDRGKLTRCESCQNVFSPHHLKENPNNGIAEICPYCGEVWCE